MSKNKRLQKGLDDLEAALHQWLGAFENKDRLVAVHQHLKGLAESARSSGVGELSARALRIEKPLAALVANPGLAAQSAIQTAAALQELLAWDAAVPPQHGGPPASQPQQVAPKGATAAPIYLFNSNPLLGEDTAMQLRYFGHSVVVVSDIERVGSAIEKRPPSALIFDFEYREDLMAKVAALAHARRPPNRHYPIAVISTRGNFKARLAAARAGVDCYFTKPVDAAALIDRLDALIVSKVAHPFRILFISDDPAGAAQYSDVLREAQMDTRMLHKPAEIFEAFEEYRPELVVMDVHTAACSGIDLTRLIRQNNVYLDVPIVFLSHDDSLSHELDAINSGADDFLAKPVDPAHLISSLSSRAERYRALRGLIMRDSLTGLFNHSAIKETLAREVASSERTRTPVTLAMIDIDFFKRVNDTHGHPVGDHVIRTLSRLLQQRLRRGDVVGRYGGEEFAVILPATPATAAIGVLDEIREAFSRIRHHADEGDFTASFSAGVADVTAHETADALFRAADAALYEAKHKGRNRIEAG
ncbi:diguanylate cyclase [Noviherbaspirillum cavernae]|nr:diguanylate cyclase [Noviherbaspirillum cavernae]